MFFLSLGRSICNVGCTSQDTLMSHAAGVKHKRRARAATAAANGTSGAAAPSQPSGESQQGGASDVATHQVLDRNMTHNDRKKHVKSDQ